LTKLAQPDKLFIDVGANIGLISIPILRNVPRSRVLSFEPSPNSSPYLQRTRLESEFRDRWEIVAKAAGDSQGNVQFCVAAPRKGAWDGLQDTKQAGATQTIEIEQTTLDAEWRRMGRPQVSCIKIDVEGAESRVLQGAAELVGQERPHILLEWSLVNLEPYGVDAHFLLNFAKAHDFDILAMPAFNQVVGTDSLDLHMLETESFLLVPRQAGISSCSYAHIADGKIP
jgi:FkbM family methyltransferase